MHHREPRLLQDAIAPPQILGRVPASQGTLKRREHFGHW